MKEDDPVFLATMDALMSGVGVLVIKNTERGFITEHVPPHKYLEFSDALRTMNEQRNKELQ